MLLRGSWPSYKECILLLTYYNIICYVGVAGCIALFHTYNDYYVYTVFLERSQHCMFAAIWKISTFSKSKKCIACIPGQLYTINFVRSLSHAAPLMHAHIIVDTINYLGEQLLTISSSD